ncbi:MAG: amidohydrolase family protein [Gammaproteobacteria bacterium]|nr:amidohydrolase family protein [Gammaproteobacteria bacterium]MBU0786296.1 amidohydrolase family protein [Gammaproteobacteria bacterium]MBU0814484.1 amidohydrolase family protein [Gammaproteobacteria bacterium]MBU1786673.1 amidohydrolase family protein [Gammaproteobacteria bacterium]
MTQTASTASPQSWAAPYQRIATEEAFAPPEMLDIYRKILAKKDVDPGFKGLMGFYMSSPSERAQHIMRCLTDLDQLRLQHMNECGIDKQVIALTAPGVQVMDKATAVSFSQVANDQLAEAVRRHPTRFVGMIAVAPQDPAAAAKEIERGVSKLGMNAVIINSHTQGEYLSDPKFWDIFAAAEAHDVPIYLHPNSMPANMIQSFQECGLDGAIYGFGVETGMHAMRIITAGVFDRFPRLQLIIGHMGEALPFWAYRLDYMHQATVRSQRYESIKPIKKKPSDYLRENFTITNSGVAWEPAIKFSQAVLGMDRVMYAMDYPYQYQADEVRAMDSMDMSVEDKTKFFQTNAERVFKIR